MVGSELSPSGVICLSADCCFSELAHDSKIKKTYFNFQIEDEEVQQYHSEIFCK
jgi:hypothetical protein